MVTYVTHTHQHAQGRNEGREEEEGKLCVYLISAAWSLSRTGHSASEEAPAP